MNLKNVIIIMGTTASGKSAIAVEVAQRLDGVVINADSMQVYKDLRVITARPTTEEMADIPDRLYGVLDATADGSVAEWVTLAVEEIKKSWSKGMLPILVGGTGMYIRALMDGMAMIPAIPEPIREKVRHLDDPYPYLSQIDPLMTSKLQSSDTQRILRAIEVMETTGVSLHEWQEKPVKPPLPEAKFHVFAVDRPREEIYERINARFDGMIEAGALEEVSALREKLGDDLAQYPIAKAHGVPELMAYLANEMTLEQAMAQAKKNTRHYAKRQLTWLRNQMPEAQWVKEASEIQV